MIRKIFLRDLIFGLLGAGAFTCSHAAELRGVQLSAGTDSAQVTLDLSGSVKSLSLGEIAASAQLPAGVPPRQRAYQLLRRHGQTVCRRKDPACASCAIAGDCPSAGHPPPLY